MLELGAFFLPKLRALVTAKLRALVTAKLRALVTAKLRALVTAKLRALVTAKLRALLTVKLRTLLDRRCGADHIITTCCLPALHGGAAWASLLTDHRVVWLITWLAMPAQIL